MNYRRFFSFLFFLVSMVVFDAGNCLAQRFGGNPASVKWYEINTDTVRVIFPIELTSDARRIAGVSSLLQRTTAPTIGTDLRKINIVLQKNTVTSNAYVGLAPWRSEYFMTPMQNSLQLGSLNWSENLAIHESRHVQQYSNFRKGLSKFAYYIAGQEGQAVANSAAIPDWFFEGDAVFQETLVSHQGRGRLPEFFNGYRSLQLAGKNYRYMKLRNGSLKDLVPNHYELGYLLVTYGRMKYGEDFWKNVTADAVRFKPLFYPMQGAIRKYTGLGYKTFVEQALDYFRSQQPSDTTGGAQLITPINDRYVHEYMFPAFIGQDSLLVLKKSYRQIPTWVLISGGKEKKLFTRDIAGDDYYSTKNGWIVYAGYGVDPRWAWTDYSNINLIHIRTRKRIRLTTKSKYFSPDLSNDGEKIAAVEVKPGALPAIHLLKSGTGELIRALPNPRNYFYTYPVFGMDDKNLYAAVRNSIGQMALISINSENGEEQLLTPFGNRVIAFLKQRGNRILFTASYNRRDEIWAYDLADKRLIPLVARATGSYQADVDPGSGAVVYSGFTAEGMLLYRQEPVQKKELLPEAWVNASNAVFSDTLFELQKPSAYSSAADTQFLVRRYRGGNKLFNLHSWRPIYDRPEWSLTFYSQNILNNFRTDVYYQYNENEGFNKFGVNGNFSALYPWITGGLSYTFDRKYNDSSFALRWNEFNANLGFRVPLNFSQGRMYKFLTFAGSFNTQQLHFRESSKPRPQDDAVNYLQGSISFSMENQRARQHIFPRYAFAVFSQLRQTVDDNTAKQWLTTASLYLPGILKTHNVVFNGAFQARDTLNNYRFSNSFPLSRGYPALDLHRMTKFGANYHFTIAYPDFGIAQMVYFLRLRANIFYDHSWAKNIRTDVTTPLRSVGAEVYFDTKWWNQQSVSFGFRYSRLLDNDVFVRPPGANQWEFILPVGLLDN